MALNTPKRVRTLASFASSPPPSNKGESPMLESPQQQLWAGAVNVNGTTTSSTYRVYGHSVGGGPVTGASHWMDGSLSPASSCGSPEFMSAHRSQYSLLHQQQQFHQSSTGPTMTVPPPPVHLATTPSHQQQQQMLQQQLQQQNEARENNRRGRPRSEALTSLMIEGSTSPSAIKCSFCNRVFPREKSLQAHLRTHTGERPYPCDYPGCNRAFTQSGQLKTHQRLHTGERPFMCSAPVCQQRFTHANRHCPDHPYDQLKRCDDVMVVAASEQNGDVLRWLEKYRMEKEDRTPTRKTPKRSALKSKSGDMSAELNNQENQSDYALSGLGFADSPSTPSNPYKSRKGLMAVLDMNAGMGASPIASKIKANPKQIQWTEPLSQEEDSADEDAPAQSTFNPKKRWLREAWQDDLARPLDSGTEVSAASTVLAQSDTVTLPEQQLTMKPQPRYVNPNEMRPTVLMVASKDRATPLLLDPPPPPPPIQNPQPTYSHDPLEQPFDTQTVRSSYTTDAYIHQPIANGSPNQPNRKWLGAMALMQLATNDESTTAPSTQSCITSTVSNLNHPPRNFNQTLLDQSYTHL